MPHINCTTSLSTKHDALTESLEKERVELVGGRTLNFRQVATDMHGPYARLWECGVMMARFLSFTEELTGKHFAVELGCGFAAPSIAMQGRVARVVATDLPEAEQSCQADEWHALDWASPDLSWLQDNSIDVLVASDAVYNVDGAKLFFSVLKALQPKLKDDVCMFMTHKHRHDDVDELLVDGLETAGWDGEELPIDEWPEMEGYVHPAID
ncbi:hypothetical protein FOZ63_010913, partial [Perkinsus olseni]